MLCAPVIYDADARKLASVPINDIVNPPGPGLWASGRLAWNLAGLFVTRIIKGCACRRSVSERYRAWYMPQPASSRSRPETGDDQLAWGWATGCSRSARRFNRLCRRASPVVVRVVVLLGPVEVELVARRRLPRQTRRRLALDRI